MRVTYMSCASALIYGKSGEINFFSLDQSKNTAIGIFIGWNIHIHFIYIYIYRRIQIYLCR